MQRLISGFLTAGVAFTAIAVVGCGNKADDNASATSTTTATGTTAAPSTGMPPGPGGANMGPQGTAGAGSAGAVLNDPNTHPKAKEYLQNSLPQPPQQGGGR